MIDLSPVNEAIREWLTTHSQLQVGLSDVPDIRPTLPYYTIYPLVSGEVSGSYLYPQEDVTLYYQLTVVGQTPLQVSSASDRARQLITGRSDSGQFETDLTLPGCNVHDRETHQVGAVVKSPDNLLFQIADLYRIKVGA